MSKVNDYRANAADCRQMADTTNNVLEKHMWHDMSESWLSMIGHAEREDFAAEVHQRGTRSTAVKVLPLESFRFVRRTHNHEAVRLHVLAGIQI